MEKVRDWYIKEYPTDKLGEEIRKELTFDNLKVVYNAWLVGFGADIYEWLGVGDSVIRERVFNELAERLNVDYDTIYNAWLNQGEYGTLHCNLEV